jgi:hypothetical protein
MDYKSLLDLPLETLVVLAAGYFGYRIAYVGRDRTHRAIDTLFLCVVFGFTAKLGGVISEYWSENEIWKAAASVCTALVVSAIWRGWVAGWTARLLRQLNISYTDGHANTFETISTSTKERVTQLVVRRRDGTKLMSNNLVQFADKPFGPCLLGQDGSVGMYITDFAQTPKSGWEEIDPAEGGHCIAFTYIPADCIAEVELRYLTTS